jgi:hypothetical protein
LVVAADAQDVFIQLSKPSQSSSILNLILGTEGSFDMSWSMRCEEKKWLTCLESSGELFAGTGEVAIARLQLNVTFQSDYSSSPSDLMGSVLIESRAKSIGSDVPFEGKQISMRIRARVHAEVCIEPDNVELLTDNGLLTIAAAGSRIGVTVGAPIVVRVHVCDCDNLPVKRFVPIMLGRRLDANVSSPAIMLQTASGGTDQEGNVLEASLPRSWYSSPGEEGDGGGFRGEGERVKGSRRGEYGWVGAWVAVRGSCCDGAGPLPATPCGATTRSVSSTTGGSFRTTHPSAEANPRSTVGSKWRMDVQFL